MAYCLPLPFARLMKRAIVSGKLNPDKMNKMDSAGRRKFLQDLGLGEVDAREVNLRFEKTKLLVDQEKAYTSGVDRLPD